MKATWIITSAKILLGSGIVIGTLLCVSPVFGVWLPDIGSDTRYTLAEASAADGNRFRVVQYWNHVDFYTTELLQIRPDGTIEATVLDGDDFKRWEVPLAVDTEHHVVSVTLRGGRSMTLAWR